MRDTVTGPGGARLGRLAAAGLAATVATVALALLAPAGSASARQGGKGTVKIHGLDVDGTDSGNPDNDPKVACDFRIEWYGFGTSLQSVTVSFVAQAPSGSGAVPATAGATAFTFTGQGDGATLDHDEDYRLDTTGLTAVVSQGYHVKVTVTTSDADGVHTKSKVFWVAPCPPSVGPSSSPSPSTSPSPSESPSESPSPSESASTSESPSPSEAPSPSESASPSASPPASPSESPASPEPSASPSGSSSPSPSSGPSASESAAPSISPSVLGVKIVKDLPATGPRLLGPILLAGVGLVAVGGTVLLAGRRGAYARR